MCEFCMLIETNNMTFGCQLYQMAMVHISMTSIAALRWETSCTFEVIIFNRTEASSTSCATDQKEPPYSTSNQKHLAYTVLNERKVYSTNPGYEQFNLTTVHGK